MPPTLLLISVLMVPPPTVVVPLDALATPPDTPEEPPVEVLVDAMEARLDPGEETAVEITWRLHTLQPTWVDLPVSGADLALTESTLDGLAVALPADVHGTRHLTVRLDGRHELRIVGTVATPLSSLDLPLLPASRGLVEIEGDWDVAIEGAVATQGRVLDLKAVDRLTASWKPAAPPAPRPVVVTSEAATAVRLGAGGLEGSSALRFFIRHGTVETLSFDMSAATDHLAVEGTGVREFSRSGSRVDVHLARPTRGTVTLSVSYRAPPPHGDDAAIIPIPTPGDCDQAWVNVLAADQSLIAPEPVEHLEAVPTRNLPQWARGLLDGTSVVAYRATGRAPRLDYRLLVFEPVEGPPTLVDEARYEVAYTRHGRVLMRARYQVRNDRRQYLHITPPAGFTAMGVRVAGDVVQPVSDGQDGLFVPLEKSVETLHGLVTFPVEVFLWGQESSWDRRGTRTLATPAVDAPVAYARWEVIMPPGLEARETEGIPTLVPDWTPKGGGLSYGRSYGSSSSLDAGHGAAPDPDVISPDLPPAPARSRKQRVVTFGMPKPAAPAFKRDPTDLPAADVPAPPPVEEDKEFLEDASQEAWNMAYRAYQDNDFEDASGWLDESLLLNPDNNAAVALQANVDVFLGGVDDEDGQGGGEVMERRIRDMARARTQSTERRQEKTKKKAEERLRAGDLEAAKGEFEALVEITRELAQVEQAEAYDQKALLQEFEQQLAEVEQLEVSEDRRRNREDRGKSTSYTLSMSSAPPDAVVHDRQTVFSFEDVTVEGELQRWEADHRGLRDYEDEDGDPDLDALLSLDGAQAGYGDDLVLDVPNGSFAVELVPTDPVFETHARLDLLHDALMVTGEEEQDRTELPASEPVARISGRTSSVTRGGGGGSASGLVGGRSWSLEGRGHGRRDEAATAPVTSPRTTDLVTRPELGVVASQLSIQIPRAGQSLRFEQRLIPENTPLTLEVGFRTERRSR